MSHGYDHRRWLVFGAISVGIWMLVHTFVVPELIPEPKPVIFIPPTVFGYDLFLEDMNAYDLMMEQQADEEEGEEVEPDDVERQIVSINTPATEEIPDEARFEDRVNRSVEDERVARDRTDTGGLGAVTGNEDLRNARREEERDDVRERADSDDRETDGTEDEEERVDEVAAIVEDPNSPTDPSDGASDTESDDPNADDAFPDDFDLSAFNPTMALAADFIGVPGDPGIDYLDLPQGDRTQLNSLENLYWSFWDRIKNQVRDHWQPSQVYRERDPTGRVFGVEDRYTVLNVTLNGDGTLRHLNVDRSCGLDFLDREAMRAIQEAEPFRNVPEALKDDSGLLRFRFGFYFEVNSSSFRIRREDW